MTAVIMAGGKGTRLKPFTAVLPKPLVPLGDMSILEILLRRLSKLGFRNVVISTGHLAELIMAVAGDGSRFGLSIQYSHEDEPLGTAGSLGQMMNLTDPVVIMNGDLLTTLDFEDMLVYHFRQNADVTIATYSRAVKIDFGVVETDEVGRFKGFREKPVYDMDVSMGVNILSGETVSKIARNEYLDMPSLILRVQRDGGMIGCFNSDCYWLDIGRVDDYALAQEKFEEHRDSFLGISP